MNRKSHTSGQIQIILLGTILFMAIILTGGLASVKPTSVQPKAGFALNNTPVETPPVTGDQNLQLKTLGFITPSPLPAPTTPPQSTNDCNHDMACQTTDESCACQEFMIKCVGGQCVDTHKSGMNPNGAPCNAGFSQWCQYFSGYGPIGGLVPPNMCHKDGWYCLGKPVIYLYPEKPQLVSVHIQTPGQIVVSDPEYKNGWNNVAANPDGKLGYNGKTYSELFYESSLSTFLKPTNGLTLTSANLPQQLDTILQKLGLTVSERNEFIAFWTPRLLALHSPFIQFSLIDSAVKQKIDNVIVFPKPDTRIEILAYFKPLATPYSGPALILNSAPGRHGFTMVEWGATIDGQLFY